LKYLCEGDVAKFIIPSHLAYGLTGDGDLIKHYQVIVVDVKLLNVACGVN
jgi:FKBP-type peptidyl-prolyl cis-trans isomerase